MVYEKLIFKVGGISDSSDAERVEENIKQMEGIMCLSLSTMEAPRLI